MSANGELLHRSAVTAVAARRWQVAAAIRDVWPAAALRAVVCTCALAMPLWARASRAHLEWPMSTVAVLLAAVLLGCFCVACVAGMRDRRAEDDFAATFDARVGRLSLYRRKPR